jgi:FMN phosphatase YigB (HAD superfamily)
MLQAVLFDLDNTLAIYDESAFFERYLKAVVPYFADLLRPHDLHQKLVAATLALSNNDGRHSNAEAFMAHFAEGLDIDREALWQRFMDFYRKAYPQLAADVHIPGGLAALLAWLRGLPLKVVVASNPLFPDQVQRQRLGWVGLHRYPFDLVTGIENMSYIKPQPAYYRQICDLIDVAPEDCLMVGNDPVNDMAAAQINMPTYLTTDGNTYDYGSFSGDSPAAILAPCYQGPLAEIRPLIERLLEPIAPKD